MKVNKEKQTLGPANSKITRIQHFLDSIDRDMNSLAEEFQAWKEQKRQWDQSSNSCLSTMEQKIKKQIKGIESQLFKRQLYCEQCIQKINMKLGSLQSINKQSIKKVIDLKRRVQNIQQILGLS